MGKMELDTIIVGIGGHQWLAAQMAEWPAGLLEHSQPCQYGAKH